MHLAPFIRDLAVILGIAGLISLLFRRIRQPVVLGYILAGMIVGPYTPPIQLVVDLPGIQIWAELGVVFLMFSLGLEFSFRKLARVGVSAILTAGSEVLFFLPVGYLTGKLLGWSSMTSLFLGAMLAISSTTIIIKALDELKLKSHRFAELIFAALIVEDLIAILLLVALSTIAASSTFSLPALLMAAVKLTLVVGGWFIAGYFIVPRFMKYVGKVGDNEILTLLSLGLCLGLVVFATEFHYSAALGAFIMGSILAESEVLHRVEDRMEPLRDLFGAVFFVSIGMLINPRLLWAHRGAIVILSLVTILGKILSTSFGALISGQSFKNSVRVGFGLAQIGEFSFIIAGLGATLHATSDFLYPVAVAVSAITTFSTPYLIRLSGPAANWLEQRLPAGVRDALNRYAIQSEEQRTGVAQKSEFLFIIFRWLINGIIVSIIFVLTSELLKPRMSRALLAWGAATVLSLPFVWAMFSAFRKHPPRPDRNESRQFIENFLLRLFTLVWLGALSTRFFSGRKVFIILGLATLIITGMFFRRLERYYQWYERRFLSVFKEGEGTGKPVDRLAHLAPWDAHLVHLHVHPNSSLVMKRLRDSGIRTCFGINLVAIQRGSETIVPPLPDEVLLPMDQLVVLGTDEQVERFKGEIEVPQKPGEPAQAPTYDLRNITLMESSPFVGQTIRESKLRERYHALVVGIERDGRRTINPDSDLKLLANDTLWLVGERTRLNGFCTRFPCS